MKIFQIITVSEYGERRRLWQILVKTLSSEHEPFVLYGGYGEAWNALQPPTKIKLKQSPQRGVSIRDIGLLPQTLLL